ncbi:MAG TPA: ankyrin repeat domain-containing protein [Planctomycetota bacterium]|nr:ankyrin repeat domain-containing protein [Planctomycetota bacterium]
MRRAKATSTGVSFGLLVFGTSCALGGAPPTAAPEAQLRAAIAPTLPLLQSSMHTWTEEATCTSCHHQALGIMALVFARERGFAIDETLFAEQVDKVRHKSLDGYADNLQGDAGINYSFGQGYRLVALAAAGTPRCDTTDVVAHAVAGNQDPWGSYGSESFRPPLEASPFTAVAFVTRLLTLYGPDGRAAEMTRRVRRSREWLEHSEPRDNEERTMRLLGLAWAGADDATVRAAADDLLQTQRADGGWAQLASRDSDAYATGQALTALQQLGGLATADPAYQRGVRFLLDTQKADGSWHVATRRRSPGLPYFETGFPHGEDQFLSFAATAWATMALCAAIDPSPSCVFHGARPVRAEGDTLAARAGMQQVHRAAAFGSLAELRRALDDGASVRARGPGDTTPLMLAVHDPDKVALLLERGADVQARSAAGNTPLILASWYSGSERAVEMLLAKGADVDAANREGLTALIQAVRTGEPGKVERLLRAGAQVDTADKLGVTALMHATFRHSKGLVRRLLDAGASLSVRFEGQTPLALAAYDGEAALVGLLLEGGAAVDEADAEGMTPLAWAAKVEHGHSEVVDLLLAAGADPARTDASGHTPLQWAEQSGNTPAVASLRAHGTPRSN